MPAPPNELLPPPSVFAEEDVQRNHEGDTTIASAATNSAAANSRHRKATLILLAATVLWGVSFPLAKALAFTQHELLPEADSWFLAALPLTVRFGVAALVVALGTWRTLGRITRRELSQGIGLGVFASGGLLLQMDGLSYTAASTSAFLTSCYCVIIPVFVAVQRRRLPPPMVAGSCALVLVGMSMLAGLDWQTLRLGRGEWETTLASGFFAGQIFWLERPLFAGNRTSHASVIMFLVITCVCLPVTLMHTHSPRDLIVGATGSPAIIGFLAVLTVFCTVFAFSIMNHWQRFLEATEAGLIYCAEPVFASVFALKLPAWLAMLGGVVYPNEALTRHLLIGGGLITLANVLIQLRPRAVTPVR